MAATTRVILPVALALSFSLLVPGCGDAGQVNAPVATDAKAAPVDDPQKQALLPQMSQVARTATQGWDTLSQDQKEPFLQFHSRDAERAKHHYETLVETEQDIMRNLGQ